MQFLLRDLLSLALRSHLMNDPKSTPYSDADGRPVDEQLEEDRDPEWPQLTDLDDPRVEPGTDIVPPAEEPERRESGPREA
jgi:hypothetical protein